jgi:class 3 adenylate cyclase
LNWPTKRHHLTGERVERRLAAVLAPDVAGYSRRMGVNEEGTLARLKAVRKTLVDPAIASHRGRIVKTTGDGMLVEFASAVDAARCAVEVQRDMAAQNADVPQDTKIEFRIGSMSATSSSTRTTSSATALISPHASRVLPSRAVSAFPRCAAEATATR